MHNLMIALAILFSLPLFGSEKPVYDLPRLIQHVESNNLEIKYESFIDPINDAEYKRVMKEFNPRLEVMFGAGPISKVTGDALKSETDYTSWGVAWLGEAEMTWPVYTWGRMELLLKAVKHKKKVDHQDIALKRNEVIYKLKESYYQTLFTYSLLDFVNDIQEKITAKMEDKKTKKTDRYQLEVLNSQLNGRKTDILKGQRLGMAAVKLFSGVNETFQLDRDYIQREKRKIKDFEHYWQLALQNKPEFIKLREGIQAKESYWESEKLELLPNVGVLLNYEYSHANITTKQQSAYAFDPYNRNDFSMGVGLQWNIDFGVIKERIRKTGVELQQLKARKLYADNGLKVLVLKAWEDAKAAGEKVEFARKGYKSGKKWVNRLASSWSMGLTQTRRLVEAYQIFAFASKDYYEAILDHHLAWAKLSQEVGVEVDPLLTK